MCSMCVSFSFTSIIIFDDTVKEQMNGLDTTVFYLTAHITASLRLLCVAAGMPNHCSNLPWVKVHVF
jgi:hypothetical protein